MQREEHSKTANSNTVPKLGFGCMRFPLTDPKDVTAIDIDQVKEKVDLFMDAGGTYFDTAIVYHDGHSEVALREALVERYPRDSFTIATKCLAWALPDAEARLLGDYKERCEHYTIVDLIRNDLNRIADRVRVERVRYVEKIATLRGEILQTSSEIAGDLRSGWRQELGDLLFSLLPAGSISGAPNPATLRLIRDAEQCPRG